MTPFCALVLSIVREERMATAEQVRRRAATLGHPRRADAIRRTIGRLARQGLAQRVNTYRPERSPEPAVWAITRKGERQLDTWLAVAHMICAQPQNTLPQVCVRLESELKRVQEPPTVTVRRIRTSSEADCAPDPQLKFG